MISFEMLKSFPKLDLQINFLSSISETLIFSLNREKDMGDMLSMNTINTLNDYNSCLSLPIKLLSSEKNLRLAIRDLIKRLKESNIIYGEIFVDLPVYNRRVPVEYLINILIDEINKDELNLSLVLCTSDEYSKEENLYVLSIYEKYKDSLVKGIYFKKEKSTNIYDYIYLFNRMIRDGIPYVVSFDTKITNQNREIYSHAKRIIYMLDEVSEELLNVAKNNHIMLSFSISKMLYLISNLDVYSLIKNLIENNYLVSINSEDMTILNTDIINEYCLLFNNVSLKLLDVIRLLVNNINSLNISDAKKDELIRILKDKSSEIL